MKNVLLQYLARIQWALLQKYVHILSENKINVLEYFHRPLFKDILI